MSTKSGHHMLVLVGTGLGPAVVLPVAASWHPPQLPGVQAGSPGIKN